MKHPETEKAPYWYFIIASFGVLWNIMGIMAYVQQVLMPQEMMSSLTPEQRDYYSEIPAWINTAFAIGVWGGEIGSVMMLARNKMSFYVLQASLAGVSVQLIYILFNGTILELLGIQGLLLPISIFLMALILMVLARFAIWRGWMQK